MVVEQAESVPFDVSDVLDEIKKLDTIECGAEARKQFMIAPQYRNLNHGSFGTYPKPVKEVFRYYSDRSEERPDAFIRHEYPQLLDVSRERIAEYLHAPLGSTVFVSNATLGVNTVLRNLVFKPGDVIIYFATIYGACGKTVKYITETTPAESKQIEYTYPVSDAFLLKSFEQAIDDIKAQGKNPKIVIYDTIVSLPGVRMPFENLTEISRKHGVLSLIDGAHSAGGIPIDIAKLDPDFYISNCHKWAYVPRGCAVFYVAERNHSIMRSTLPTSHGFIPQPSEDGSAASLRNPLPPSKKTAFVTSFEFVGTLDNSPFLCIPAALEWRKKLTWNDKKGEEAIYTYLIHLAQEGGKIVSSDLGTEIMNNEEGTLTDCFFTNVRLPLDFQTIVGGDFDQGIKVAQFMSEVLVQKYDTFMAIISYGDAWWVRLSAQVYLTIDDFKWAGVVLEEVCDMVRRGKWTDQ